MVRRFKRRRVEEPEAPRDLSTRSLPAPVRDLDPPSSDRRPFPVYRLPPIDLEVPDLDARRWHPEDSQPGEAPARPYRRVSGAPARLVPAPRAFRSLPSVRGIPAPPPARMIFASPDSSVICVRRSVRRSVLLATGKGGRNRRGRWKAYSKVRC